MVVLYCGEDAEESPRLVPSSSCRLFGYVIRRFICGLVMLAIVAFEIQFLIINLLLLN